MASHAADLVGRIRRILREEGLPGLWFRVLGRTLYRSMVLVERPLDEPVAEVAPGVPIAIALLREHEVDEYRRFRPHDSLADVRRWWTSGRLCFVARHDGRIVHSCWISRGPTWIDYLGVELPLGPDEVCACGSFTDPEFRGFDIASARLAHTLRYLQDEGYRRMLSVVVTGNQPSLAYAQQGGYRIIGTIGWVGVGPWRRAFVRTIPGAWRPGVPLRRRP